jgi:hypothetical protein
VRCLLGRPAEPAGWALDEGPPAVTGPPAPPLPRSSDPPGTL